MTPMKAIRAKCLECSGDSYKEVKLCPIKNCPLYSYRFGHNPARQGKGIGGKGFPKNPPSVLAFMEQEGVIV